MKSFLPPKKLEDLLTFKFRLAVLRACKGNRTNAAYFCGISVRNLRLFVRDCKASGVDVPDCHESTRGISNKENPLLEAILKYVFAMPTGNYEVTRSITDTHPITDTRSLRAEILNLHEEIKYLRAELGHVARRTARYAKEKI